MCVFLKTRMNVFYSKKNKIKLKKKKKKKKSDLCNFRFYKIASVDLWGSNFVVKKAPKVSCNRTFSIICAYVKKNDKPWFWAS